MIKLDNTEIREFEKEIIENAIIQAEKGNWSILSRILLPVKDTHALDYLDKKGFMGLTLSNTTDNSLLPKELLWKFCYPFAHHVLWTYENCYKGDSRIRNFLRLIKDYTHGDIEKKELNEKVNIIHEIAKKVIEDIDKFNKRKYVQAFRMIDAARFASEGNAHVVAERSCEAASENDACYDPGWKSEEKWQHKKAKKIIIRWLDRKVLELNWVDHSLRKKY